MSFPLWSLIIGLLMLSVALAGSLLKRLPISTSIVYMAVGFALSMQDWGPMVPNPENSAALFARVTEVALLISLFSVGIKLGRISRRRQWFLPIRLAFVSMAGTVALIAAIGVFFLGLPLGAAVLLGGILAPTDPVLASDVQIDEPADRDRLRFSLTGEGGLNDGAAFPFVMLGLGLLGLHELGDYGWRWVVVDVLWTVIVGLALGALLGALTGKLVVHLRTRHNEAVGLDEFLSLGLVAVAYGAAQLASASGFLAAFAAGLAVQYMQKRPLARSGINDGPAGLQSRAAHIAVATHPELAGAYLMQTLRNFNEQIERIAELVLVLVVGFMLPYTRFDFETVSFMVLIFVVVRPLTVSLGLYGTSISSSQRALMSWFGIRGIGSIYYLMFALDEGVSGAVAERIIALTLTTVAVSIVVHGISVTPLMTFYARHGKKRRRKAAENTGSK